MLYVSNVDLKCILDCSFWDSNVFPNILYTIVIMWFLFRTVKGGYVNLPKLERVLKSCGNIFSIFLIAFQKTLEQSYCITFSILSYNYNNVYTFLSIK